MHEDRDDEQTASRDESNQQTPHPQPARAMRFTYRCMPSIVTRDFCSRRCLSCDRAVIPTHKETASDVHHAQGRVSLTGSFRTPATTHPLRLPLGPGLNAAELRKIHSISEKDTSQSCKARSHPIPTPCSMHSTRQVAKESASTGPVDPVRAEAATGRQVFLYDDRQNKLRPRRLPPRSRTPIFL